MTLSKQQPQVREGYMVKINGKFVGEENVLVFFLGEKWFYTTGFQRSLSHLPWGPCEPEVVDRVKRPIAISPCFPGKVMFRERFRINPHEHHFAGKAGTDRYWALHTVNNFWFTGPPR